MIVAAMAHQGFALVDILQPCVSFNKVNTFAWYKQRCHKLPGDYDPTDYYLAFAKASQWGEEIPVGIIYRNDRRSYEEDLPVLAHSSLIEQKTDRTELIKIMEEYQ